MKKGAWDRELCKEMNLREDILPEIAACHEIVGRVTKEAAQQSGLSVQMLIPPAWPPCSCVSPLAITPTPSVPQAESVGVIANGETQEQGGQAGGMSICTDKYRADKRLIVLFAQIVLQPISEHRLLRLFRLAAASF
jgi:xylulokinase